MTEEAAPQAEQATTAPADAPADTAAAPQAEQATVDTEKAKLAAFDDVAHQIDAGQTTLDRGSTALAELLDIEIAEARAGLIVRLPDGHPEKPVAQEPAPQAVVDESKIAAPAAVGLPTVEDAAADLEANPARTASLSADGFVVRE